MIDIVDLKKWVDSEECINQGSFESFRNETSLALSRILEKYIELEHFKFNPHVENIMLSTGNVLIINPSVSNVISQLRSLRLIDIINVMKCSDKEINDFYIEYRETLKIQVLDLLSKDWFYRETAEPLIYDEYTVQYMSGYQTTKRKLISWIKKDKLSIAELKGIIEFFTHEKTEVYNNEPYN